MQMRPSFSFDSRRPACYTDFIFACNEGDFKMTGNIKNAWRRMPSWLLPALILLLGAGLRFVLLGSVPAGLHQDESFVALNSYDLYHEGRDSGGYVFPVYMSSWGDGQSALYSYLLTLLLALTGGEMSAFLCRLPQAAAAVFTLLSVYFLTKRLFGRWMGIWSLFLLSVCPWHIMMSRWALDANLLPGFLIFGLTFFIRGLEQPKYLLLSALFYGLSLYCYAVVWPVLPILLLLQTGYALLHKKITFSLWSAGSVILLGLLAVPLLLFLMVNYDLIPEISLPFLTIPKTPGFRGGEVSFRPSQMKINLYNALRLFVFQNTGSPYDIIETWGLFYDIGRFFIMAGVVLLAANSIKALVRRSYANEIYIVCSLIAGGVTCLLVTVRVHQLNNLFIPLVLCEAYGIVKILDQIKKRRQAVSRIAAAGICLVYLLCLTLFQRDYYTSYRQLVNAYFAEGVEECVTYALTRCSETGLSSVTAEKGTQWPRLLLFTQTLPSDYFASVEYDVYPAPAAFTTHDGVRINTRISYDALSRESVYIIYYTDVPLFENDYELTQFCDWYVAVPKAALN